MTTHAFAPRFDLSNVFLPAAAERIPEARDSESSFALARERPAGGVGRGGVARRRRRDHRALGHAGALREAPLQRLELLRRRWRRPRAPRGRPRCVARSNRRLARRWHVRRRPPRRTRPRHDEGRHLAAVRYTRHACFVRAHRRLRAPARHGMSVTLEIGAERADGTTASRSRSRIGTVRAGKVAPVGFLAALAGGATGFVGLSFLGHAAIVASLAMFMPQMSTDDADGHQPRPDDAHAEVPERVRRARGRAAPEGDRPRARRRAAAAPARSTKAPRARPARTRSSEARPHRGEGQRGDVVSLARRGAQDRARVRPRRPARLVDAARPERAHLAVGEGSAEGLVRGVRHRRHVEPDIDDATGTGLGLWGTGEGGGGKGAGRRPRSTSDTIGGGGGGTGQMGHRPRRQGRHGHRPRPRRRRSRREGADIRTPTLSSNGRLPAEVIQRIVRQNFGRFRLCYEGGLRDNPGLSGRVATKFVIGREAAVMQARTRARTSGPERSSSCVVRSFNSLSFPAPEGGVATVTYPIILSPGE